jgi:CMP-N,N'-diacetyllegionaminic acid synthase
MASNESLKILGIVPARKGSKRVPGKNTRKLAGIPLIEYVLRACRGSKKLTSVVVSSDDEEVKSIVRSYQELRFIQRPEELSTDMSPAIDYVRHVMKVTNESWDIIVIIQPTTPFVRSEDIDNTIELLVTSRAQTSVSVVKIEQLHHPFKLKVMDGNTLLPFLKDEGNIKAAHELPDVYSRNGGVYASWADTIRQGLIIGDPCVGYVMPYERSVDINYPIDFDFAEFLAVKYSLKPDAKAV